MPTCKDKKVIYIHIYIVILLFSHSLWALEIKETYVSDRKFDFSIRAECGTFDSRTLYASFGYERQISSCHEFIFISNMEYKNPESDSGTFYLRSEFAPIYNSLVTKPRDTYNKIIYKTITAPNGDVVNIDGTVNFDWYKNIGDRIYNINSNFPFRQLYISWVSENRAHLLKIGSQINNLSFSNDEMIWGDNSWFSPISYFFSKDLYSGFSYTFSGINNVSLVFEFLSGDGNTTKNNFYYSQNGNSSNLKSNNTPIIGFNISYNYGSLISDRVSGKIFAGTERTKVGSTFDEEIQEGKHNRNVTVIGLDFKYNFLSKYLSSIKLFGQYTFFESGLAESSSQNTGHSLFKDIMQEGFFVGLEFGLLNERFEHLQIGLTYEKFDRYDYRAHFYTYGPNSLGNLDSFRNSKQESYIINMKYYIVNGISVNLGYHRIKNPLYWISNILSGKYDNLSKFTIFIEF
jgi:hypothetical protein